jgi:hypothetical protein
MDLLRGKLDGSEVFGHRLLQLDQREIRLPEQPFVLFVIQTQKPRVWTNHAPFMERWNEPLGGPQVVDDIDTDPLKAAGTVCDLMNSLQDSLLLCHSPCPGWIGLTL